MRPSTASSVVHRTVKAQVAGPFRRAAPKSFELLHRPSNNVLVDALCEEVQLGAVEEGGGRELPPPAPVKPDVTVSRHPAYYSDRDPQGSSPSPGWLKSPIEVRSLRSRAITAPSSLLRRSPPQCAASGTLTFGFSASAYSRSLCCRETTARLVPVFHPKARHHAHAPLTPDTAWPGTRQPARLIPGQSLGPGSDVIQLLYDASSEGSLSLVFVVHT